MELHVMEWGMSVQNHAIELLYHEWTHCEEYNLNELNFWRHGECKAFAKDHWGSIKLECEDGRLQYNMWESDDCSGDAGAVDFVPEESCVDQGSSQPRIWYGVCHGGEWDDFGSLELMSYGSSDCDPWTMTNEYEVSYVFGVCVPFYFRAHDEMASRVAWEKNGEVILEFYRNSGCSGYPEGSLELGYDECTYWPEVDSFFKVRKPGTLENPSGASDASIEVDTDDSAGVIIAVVVVSCLCCCVCAVAVVFVLWKTFGVASPTNPERDSSHLAPQQALPNSQNPYYPPPQNAFAPPPGPPPQHKFAPPPGQPPQHTFAQPTFAPPPGPPPANTGSI